MSWVGMASPSDQHFNVAFIVIEPKTSGYHYNSMIQRDTSLAIVGIVVSVLVSLLQIKYQSADSASSPFHTHPTTMSIAISTFLIYCLGSDSQPYITSSSRFSTRQATIYLYTITMRLLIFISVASFASVVFSTHSNSSSVMVYLLFAILFSARLLLKFLRNTENCSCGNVHSHTDMSWMHSILNDMHTLPVFHKVSVPSHP